MASAFAKSFRVAAAKMIHPIGDDHQVGMRLEQLVEIAQSLPDAPTADGSIDQLHLAAEGGRELVGQQLGKGRHVRCGAGHARGVQSGRNAVAADADRDRFATRELAEHAVQRTASRGWLKAGPGLGSLVGDLDLLVVKPMAIVKQHRARRIARLIADAARRSLGWKQIGRLQKRNPRTGRCREPPLGVDTKVLAFFEGLGSVGAGDLQDPLGHPQQARSGNV